MQLQTQRNLEYFLGLIGIKKPQIEPVMAFQLARNRLHLEIRQQRLFITTALVTSTAQSVLLTLFQQSDPSYFFGHIARFFRLEDGVAISCVTPDQYSAEQWMGLYQSQCRLLNRCSSN